MNDERKRKMTGEEITATIANISEQMRGPLNNVERACLHEERKELRAKLAELETTSKEPTP